MVCAERDNVIRVTSVYGLNMLMCDRSGQAQGGKEQFGEGTFQGARVCLEQIELTVKFAVIEVAHLPIT